ncbi:MAG: hypothetical protein DMG24_12995, partial [Acidobacteria bacterium]
MIPSSSKGHQRYRLCQGAGHVMAMIILALLTPRLASGRVGPPTATSTRLFTQAQQVRDLSAEQANRGYPVRLRGAVTFVDDFGFFFQDATAGIAVMASGRSHDLQAGQFIELEGVTECPDFAPQISKVRIRHLGSIPLPAAKRLTFERLASTEEDSQWAEIEGIVRAVVRDEISVPPAVDATPALRVAVSGGDVLARVPWMSEAEAARFIDCRVRVRGAVGAIYNQRNMWVGVRLFVPNGAQLKILEPASSDPFAIPAQSVFSVLSFNLRGSCGHRIRLQGIVTLQRLGRALYVNDETGSIT